MARCLLSLSLSLSFNVRDFSEISLTPETVLHMPQISEYSLKKSVVEETQIPKWVTILYYYSRNVSEIYFFQHGVEIFHWGMNCIDQVASQEDVLDNLWPQPHASFIRSI